MRGPHLSLTDGAKLLRGRYELVGQGAPAAGGAEVWRGLDLDGAPYLIKTWAYEGADPDLVRRALWDAELRTLYKVGSTPGAGESLVVLKDAGVDRDARCFVMVLESFGNASVASILAERHRHPWLALGNPSGRREIWEALARVASGLALLHEQQVLHRNIGVESLVFDAAAGPDSIRLGGFEWSVRLGRPLDADPPNGWASLPERSGRAQQAWRPDDDWFGFGILATRLLIDIESLESLEPSVRHRQVLTSISRTGRSLSEHERIVLSRLLAADPLERMTRGRDVLESARAIVRQLSSPALERHDQRPFTLVINTRATVLIDYLLDNGLREHLALDATASYNPNDHGQASAVTDFMRRDLDGGLLYAVPKRTFFVLVGR